MCGSQSCAEDVVQEAFLSLWRTGARYDRTRGSVRAWILSAVHNRAIDAFRRHSARESRDVGDENLTEYLPAGERTDAEVERRDDAHRVRGPVWIFNWSAGQWVGALGVAATAILVVVALLASTARPPTRVIQAQVTSGTGSAQLDVTGKRGELIVRHLSLLPRGRVYEVWLKAAHSKPVPADVLFLVTRHGDADVPVPRSLRGMSLMMVTAERAGGSPVPTGKPVIVAQLT
jgi:RNA polymerase sigma factor (sigma-70 family)